MGRRSGGEGGGGGGVAYAGWGERKIWKSGGKRGEWEGKQSGVPPLPWPSHQLKMIALTYKHLPTHCTIVNSIFY